MNKLLVIVLLPVLLLIGCSATEAWEEALYFTSVNATDLEANDYYMNSSIVHLKSGANQTAANATTGELWVDTSDNNTIKLGK